MGRTSCLESSCSPFLFSYFFLFFLIVNADRAGSGKRPCRKQPHRRRPCRHTWSAAAGLVRRIPNSANLKWENAANQIALKPTEDIVQNYVQDHVQNGAQMRAMGATMSLLGNFIWILFGGIFTAIYWFFMGCLFCLTIVGIPLSRQAFKMAKLSLLPFGARVN